MTLASDIEKYINDNKIDAMDIVKQVRASSELVMYGELHVGLSKKAEFFSRLIKDSGDRYHASEHFENSVSLGSKVEKYLKGKITKSLLPSRVRPLAPVLDAIKPRTANTGLVYAGIKSHSGRDKAIFENFKSSRALHIKAKRFKANDPGHFHIGAAHGARLPFGGSTATTTQLLLKDGFKLASVRVIVNVTGSSSTSGTTLTIVAGESETLAPIAGGDSIELLDIVKRVGAGNSFGVNLGKRSSPFSKVRPEESTSSDGYDKYFDALLYIP